MINSISHVHFIWSENKMLQCSSMCMSGQDIIMNWPRFLDLSKLCEINVCTSSSVWFIREIFSFHRQNSLWIWLTLWQLTDPETIETHNGRNQQPWIPLLRSNSFLSNSISTLTIKVSNFSERILGNGIFWQSSSPFSQCAC